MVCCFFLNDDYQHHHLHISPHELSHVNLMTLNSLFQRWLDNSLRYFSYSHNIHNLLRVCRNQRARFYYSQCNNFDHFLVKNALLFQTYLINICLGCNDHSSHQVYDDIHNNLYFKHHRIWPRILDNGKEQSKVYKVFDW